MTGPDRDGVPFLRLGDERHGDGKGIWHVDRPLLIGRERADITVALAPLSRRHAEVALVGHGCQIRDLDSKNGTAVNGRMLARDPCALRHGDVIVLAGLLELRFDDPGATPVVPRLGRLEGLWIDPVSRDVWVDARRLSPPLSRMQDRLLQIVVEADGRVVSRDEIAGRLWRAHEIDGVSNDAVDSLIKRLRRRLATVERGETVLEVIRGRGIRVRQTR